MKRNILINFCRRLIGAAKRNVHSNLINPRIRRAKVFKAKRDFWGLNGTKATLNVPLPRESDSIFVVAGHKTGSTLLTNIIDDIAGVTGMPAIAVEESVWRQGWGIKEWPDELYDFLESDGYIFYSFRSLQKLPHLDSFDKSKKIFLIRDPRDIAVSYYFSMRMSHGVPKQGSSRNDVKKLRSEAENLDIDDYIQGDKVGGVLRNIESFSRFYGDSNSVFYKYEVIIYDKKDWVSDIADVLSVELSQEQADIIARKHDIFPKRENIYSHVRSVKPGGYREKLSAESIDFIRHNYPVFFDIYGYV